MNITNKIFDEIVNEVSNTLVNKTPLFARIIEGHLSNKLIEYDVDSFKYDEMMLLEEAIINKIAEMKSKQQEAKV